jgi:hypothetical protein
MKTWHRRTAAVVEPSQIPVAMSAHAGIMNRILSDQEVRQLLAPEARYGVRADFVWLTQE